MCAIKVSSIKEPSVSRRDYSQVLYHCRKDKLRIKRITFSLVQPHGYNEPYCQAKVIFYDSSVSDFLPVNEIIAKNFVHLLKEETPLEVIEEWYPTYRIKNNSYLPTSIPASKDMIGLLLSIRDAFKRNPMTFPDDYYSFIWTNKIIDDHDKIFMQEVEVILKKTIETTCELRDRGLPYDGDSLKLKK